MHLVWERSEQVTLPERVVGVWTHLWERRLEGRGVVRGVKLRAGAARALFDDASAWRNRIAPLGTLFASHPVSHAFGTEPEQDASVFTEILAWFAGVRRDDPDTALAVQIMERVETDASLMRVDQLCSATGFSERALQRLFRLHVGASPKQVLRRTRLQEAALRLERGAYLSLADLALELGYADQAHFTRDWRDTVALTPTAFVQQAGATSAR